MSGTFEQEDAGTQERAEARATNCTWLSIRVWLPMSASASPLSNSHNLLSAWLLRITSQKLSQMGVSAEAAAVRAVLSTLDQMR